MSKVPKNKAYAFWNYDLFPFCLGGKVVEIYKDGNVQTEEYGSFRNYGRYFTDETKGKKLLDDLADLRLSKQMEQKKLDQRYNRALNKALKDAGIVRTK